MRTVAVAAPSFQNGPPWPACMDAARGAIEALYQRERRYHAWAEAGGLALWQVSTRGALTQVTGWKWLTGRDDGQALGSGWLRRVHRDDRAVLRRTWRAVRREGRLLDLEFRLSTLRQGWRWVRARGAFLAEEPGVEACWMGMLEDVHERHLLQARALHMAHHDSLTGLPNRASLALHLAQAVARARQGQPAALLYLDLDRFKHVNDTFGHEAGDALLRAVAGRLRSGIREGDLAARRGGDEFVILLRGVDSEAPASVFVSRMIERLIQPYEVAGRRVEIGVSVGIAFVTADAGEGDAVLRRADAALYQAKRAGCSGYRFAPA